VRGLLLAGACRFTEALAVARDLPPLEFRRYGWMQTGAGVERSTYASNWIEAMAWLQRGDGAQAVAALGELYPDRPRIPFMQAYWNDVGLIFETAGRIREARRYYTLAALAAPYRLYFAWSVFTTRPLADGEPPEGLPVFVSRTEGRFAGSLFGYGIQLAAESLGEPDAARAMTLRQHAEAALAACVRRGIRPALAESVGDCLRAGRGRRPGAAGPCGAFSSGALRHAAPRAVEEMSAFTRDIPPPDAPLFWSLFDLYDSPGGRGP
jgi:hypothetical protein